MIRKALTLFTLLLFTQVCLAQKPTTGPEKGHLIIAGGALQDAAVFNKFIELSGGSDALIIVIPTAGGYEVTSQTKKQINELPRGRASRYQNSLS